MSMGPCNYCDKPIAAAFVTPRPCTSILLLLFLFFFLLLLLLLLPAPLASCEEGTIVTHTANCNVCPKTEHENLLFLHDNDLCLPHQNDEVFTARPSSRVAEINGTTLEIALDILRSEENNAYAAVLFYANWCPFSMILRQLLDQLSVSSPQIYHLAVDDSSIEPSALSRHGVHSFPVLFLQNKTTKLRYYGPRTIEAIGAFYKHTAGIASGMHNNLRNGDGIALVEKLSAKGLVQHKPNCPYPWAKSPEKWLHNDMYLMLATVFLLGRGLMFLMPRLWTGIRNCWKWKENCFKAYKLLFRRVSLREQGIKISECNERGEVDDLFKGKRVLSLSG